MFYPWHVPTFATRPWRLFRELDDFSDAECRVFIRDLHRTRSLLLAVAFPIAGVLGVSVVAGSHSAAESIFGRNSAALDNSTLIGRLCSGALMCVVLVIVPPLSLAPYLLFMPRAIRRLLDRVVCPSCRYSLLGLPLDGDHVLCPECGLRFALADQGLTAGDIFAGSRRRSSTRPPPMVSPRVLAICAAIVVADLTAWIVTGSPSVLLALLVALGVVSTIAANRQSSRAES